MTDPQPLTVVEGATTGDVDDEIPVVAKSAEDRKAAAALSSLDAARDDESKPAKDVDQEAVRKAMDRLAGTGASNGTLVKKTDEKKEVRKVVKVNAADVTLLVCPWERFLNAQREHQTWIPLFHWYDRATLAICCLRPPCFGGRPYHPVPACTHVPWAMSATR